MRPVAVAVLAAVVADVGVVVVAVEAAVVVVSAVVVAAACPLWFLPVMRPRPRVPWRNRCRNPCGPRGLHLHPHPLLLLLRGLPEHDDVASRPPQHPPVVLSRAKGRAHALAGPAVPARVAVRATTGPHRRRQQRRRPARRPEARDHHRMQLRHSQHQQLHRERCWRSCQRAHNNNEQ
jgi:hypothetical protein